MSNSLLIDFLSPILGLSFLFFYMCGWLSCTACRFVQKKFKSDNKDRRITELWKLKVLKMVYIPSRALSKRLYKKSKIVRSIYHWADLKIYKKCKGVYVLPEWLWRLIAALLNCINNKNTVDINKVRSKRLENLIDNALHRVPKEYRYPKMNPFNVNTIGQDGD